MPHCGSVGPEGWRCILSAGHEGDCMSLDNRQMWEGSPGLPIRWARPAITRDDVLVSALDPTTVRGEAGVPAKLDPVPRVGPKEFGVVPKSIASGNPCTVCGNTMQRTGKCETCPVCGESGGCG